MSEPSHVPHARGLLGQVPGLLGAVAAAVVLSMAGTAPASEVDMGFELTSTAFENGGIIPQRCTCDGDDVSPALQWSKPPDGTKSFALVVDDPDAPAGTWLHWTIYDIPATLRELPENVPRELDLPFGARQGRNDFGKIGWGGPCPPPGPEHTYRFTLLALDLKLALHAGASRPELERAVEGHVLATALLTGRYGRARSPKK